MTKLEAEDRTLWMPYTAFIFSVLGVLYAAYEIMFMNA